jgi:hypothetical protein
LSRFRNELSAGTGASRGKITVRLGRGGNVIHSLVLDDIARLEKDWDLYVSADPVKTSNHAMQPMQVYEVRPRKDKRGVDLISDALPFGRLWYGEPDARANAVGYAKFFSRSHDAVIRVYDEAGNVFETHEHAGDFREC